ncbi:ABC transporter permease subunit [Microbacterium sp. ARD31]|uniref:ABC transporter permease n=1 Tax=Microbacterium sp. ARD31 TaxID=2962576 RepID=UPI002882BD0E|nr:ABC transporter permease subunit [Microbacterium sp. ARD31]MDT0183948.1 ABC transporter permease subunit [Microbacterium sp. ARD31]
MPVLLLVWWWLAAPYASPADLPEPGAVLNDVVSLLIGPDAYHTWTSLIRIFAAVLFALIIGSFAVFLTRVLPISETLVGAVLLPFLNSVPALGWAILGVVWFGVGNFAVIFVVTLILIPFCMVNIWEGLRSLDPGLQEMGKSFTRSNTKILWRIQAPMLIPYILAAVRLSFSVGWKVALIAEFFGAQAGLGLVMNRARQSFDTPMVFATIIVVLIIVTVTERLVFDPLARMFARRSGTGVAR